MDTELNKRIVRFLEMFELVFNYDWDCTKSRVLDNCLITEQGTFLNPYPGEQFVGGEGDNWANRSSLIAAYRNLRTFAISEGIIYQLDDGRYEYQGQIEELIDEAKSQGWLEG